MCSDSADARIEAVAFVVNPSSGGGGGDWLYMEIARLLRERGVQIAAFETTRDRGARPAAEAALRAGFPEIWVIGGDGTIQQCLEPIVAAGAVLGPIPGGTSNRLVEVLGLASDDPVEQARWMLDQPVHAIDVGACDGGLFTVRAGVGIEALAARLTEDDKSGLGNLSYILAGVKAAHSARAVTARLSAGDDLLYEGLMLSAIITNLPFVVPLKVPGIDRATPTDGLLHVTIIPERPDLRVLWQWLLRQRPESAHGAAFYYSGAHYHLTLDQPAEVHLDGEMIGTVRELDLQCRPGALRVRGLRFGAGT
ncbi:MAG: diacylglycerol kinase family protein [Armatimonadota bacterium]